MVVEGKTSAMLSSAPEPIRLARYNEWQQACAAVDVRATRLRPSAADGVAQ
jgi:hypothetical protein